MLEWSFIYQNIWLFQPISHSKKLQFQILESQLPSTFTKLALTWKTNPRSIRAVSVTWPLTVYTWVERSNRGKAPYSRAQHARPRRVSNPRSLD